MTQARRSLFALILCLPVFSGPAPAAEPACSQPPPEAALRVSGPQIRIGERWIVGPEARLEVEPRSGDAAWVPVVDGRELSPGPWPAGEHQAAAVAVDACGNRVSIPPVSFVVDTEPPALRWERQDLASFEKRRKNRDGSWWSSRPGGGPRGLSLAWTTEHQWLPLKWEGEARGGVYGIAEIRADLPHLYLHAGGVQLRTGANEPSIRRDQILHLSAEDTGSSVERLTVRARAAREGEEPGAVLEVEAVDAVGNARRVVWPLLPLG